MSPNWTVINVLSFFGSLIHTGSTENKINKYATAYYQLPTCETGRNAKNIHTTAVC